MMKFFILTFVSAFLPFSLSCEVASTSSESFSLAKATTLRSSRSADNNASRDPGRKRSSNSQHILW